MRAKTPAGRTRKATAATAIMAALALAATAIMAGCSSVTEEHIKAGPDAITFDRVVGRKAVSAGFSLNKDSLVVKPL